jgi:type VI secretion system protein ImpC
VSTAEPSRSSAQAAEVEVKEGSLLDQAIKATRQTERSRAQDLLRTLTEEALKGTITWSKDVTRTINAGIQAIDAAISKQLAAVLHTPEFQKLEGSWRGLNYLVMNSETSAQLKLKVLNVSKRDLFKDVDRAVEFDQSQIFKKLYENEFGTPGGEPYGALIGDYEFESFTELSKPRDLEKIFDTVEYTKWKSFRESEDSRFVVLAMPRVLARLPYGSQTKPVEEFNFEEVEMDSRGRAKPVSHDHYTWMNAAYMLGTRLTDAFSQYGFCVAIRGAEGGGKVEGLPAHIFTSDDGDPDLKCPTEIGITDRREAELSKLGFLPLCHYKNTDYAVFFGAQSAQKPKKYDRPEASANAAISARLPHIMATSRFAHYLKVIARDKIGSFMEVENCQDWLERWIANYVSADPKPSSETKARYPLREAKIQVQEIPGQPGAYNAVAWLRPWLQLEELTTSLRLVARIPQLQGA